MIATITRVTTAALATTLVLGVAVGDVHAMGNGFENEQRREAAMARLDDQKGEAREAFQVAGISAVVPGVADNRDTSVAADTSGPDPFEWTAPWETGQYTFDANMHR